MEGRSARIRSRSVVAGALAVMTTAFVMVAASGAVAGKLPTKLKAMTTVRPLKGALPNVSASVPQLKTWSSSIKVGATTYHYTMVGKNVKKKQAKPSTTVTVPVIPLIIKYTGFTS